MNIAKITVTDFLPNGKKQTTFYYINTITGEKVDSLSVTGLIPDFNVSCASPC